MKKTLKKAISMLMSIVLVATLIPANAANPSAVQDAEKEVTYNATNSLGEVLSDAMEMEAEENNGYFIQDVSIVGLVAEAQISAPDGTTLVVAIYDEESGEMITSGKASVNADTETANVSLGECDMPEFFVVKAFLLDENNAPVCQNYEGLSYTEAYQEFLSKTTDDFDEEKVINLDNGKESNFAVVSDGTIVVEQTLGANTVVTDDYENGIYAFENADEELKSLESGDVLYYVYGDGPEDYILTKVGEIEIDGDKVIIEAADDAEISDLFSYIKIDTSKSVAESDGPVMSGAHYDDDSGNMDDSSNEFKVSVTKEFKSSEHVSASFTGELSVKFYLQFYYDFHLFKEDYYELTQTTTATFTGTTEIKAEAEHEWEPIKLFSGNIPIFTGLNVVITLELQIKVAAQVSVSGGIEIKLVGGSRKVSGKPEEDLSKDPSVKLKFSIEGKAKFDIIPSFSVGLKILKVFKISGEVSSDLCISATAVLAEAESGSLFSDDVLHSCALCIDGDVTATFSINIKFEFGINKKKQKTILDLNLFNASTKLGDFYISFIALDDGSLSYADFGFGECPFCEYKVTFNVVDENGKPLENVKISDDVNVIETDSKGKAYCYYKDGTYTYSVTRDGYEIDTLKMNFDELVFVVHGDTVTVNVYMKNSDNTSGVLDSGTCGDNLTWTLYKDGELVISGTGNMYNWYQYDEAPWYSNCLSIKSVTIGNGVTSIGEAAFISYKNLTSVTIGNNVTCIGVCAFADCRSLTSVTIPDSVTNIGDSAFFYCCSLTSVTIPESVTVIDDWAFSRCTSLTSVTIPESVTSIGIGAFNECVMLTSIKIPDSVKIIGPNAFASCANLKNIILSNNVTYIDNATFRSCLSLEKITIPQNVKTIYGYAFGGCTNLKYIVVPESVTTIEDFAFEDCTSLKNVYYFGSKKQWDKISILYNPELTSANITYNYVIPETVSLNSSPNAVMLSGSSNSSKTVYNAQECYFYTVMAVKNKSASDLLSNENLLFIDQKTAKSSTLTFDVLVPESVTDYEIIITTNAPDEPDDEPPVIPTEPSTKPVEVPNTTRPAETEPSTKPVEVPTTTKPAETEPLTKPVEVPTTTKPAETEPSTKPVEVPTTTKPAETEPSTKPVETPTTKPTEPSTKHSVPSTEPTTKPVTPPVTETKATVEIRKPSQTEIKYGDSIVLHADVDIDLPNGYYIDWLASNGNFDTVVSSDGTTCTVSPYASGDTIFTAIVYDSEGNVIATDTQTMTSKAGFFQKIIAFFKKLFGLTKVYPEIFKGIF